VLLGTRSADAAFSEPLYYTPVDAVYCEVSLGIPKNPTFSSGNERSRLQHSPPFLNTESTANRHLGPGLGRERFFAEVVAKSVFRG
jgi:hypothetical protein